MTEGETGKSSGERERVRERERIEVHSNDRRTSFLWKKVIAERDFERMPLNNRT